MKEECAKMTHLREALSLSPYPHITIEDNKGFVGLQLITHSKNKQPAIIEKNSKQNPQPKPNIL